MPEIPSLADWTSAVKDLLSDVKAVAVKLPDGSEVTKLVHATDPPETTHFHRAPRPGPLPVLLDELPKGQNGEAHEHTVSLEDVDLPHLAYVVVCEARRNRAKAVVLKAPKASAVEGLLVFEVVNLK